MIRGTKNQSIKTIARSGMASQSIELCEGSLNGIAASQLHEMTQEEWDANNITNPTNTVTIVPSDDHWPE